jgi:(p)ppGpp synthase/HD superfamily hydrolase
VIEDVENGREKIKQYPQEIIDLVDSVTEQDKSLPWQERKEKYLEHIKEYQFQSLVLSLSDRIQNLRDMIE